MAIIMCVLRNGHRMNGLSSRSWVAVNRIKHKSFWDSGKVNIVFLDLSAHHVMCLLCNIACCCYCCCSIVKSCPTLCNPMDWSMPGSSALHYLPEFSQIPVHWVGDAIQPSHPLLPPFPPALNLSQHQCLF